MNCNCGARNPNSLLHSLSCEVVSARPQMGDVYSNVVKRIQASPGKRFAIISGNFSRIFDVFKEKHFASEWLASSNTQQVYSLTLKNQAKVAFAPSYESINKNEFDCFYDL